MKTLYSLCRCPEIAEVLGDSFELSKRASKLTVFTANTHCAQK